MLTAIRASGINRISLIPRANLAPVEHPAAAILYLCTAAADDLVGKDLALTDPRFPPADPSRLIEFSNSHKLAGRE
jgi:hypothetical protein